tara:strand:+ start:10158 stop:11477 length:1320 start_codon:yes stop_codon:yes gene_type:complete
MANTIKNQQDILDKLKIYQLNPMQEDAISTIEKTENTILLSPTGTGKTLAFLLPMLEKMSPDIEEVQAVIVVPSRELAIQIEQVIRVMGTGYKVNAIYGGRTIAKDKIELKHRPAILIGTPGRLSDHLGKGRFTIEFVKTLIIDEFDVSFEVGAGGDMQRIGNILSNVTTKVLTSATQAIEIPAYIKMDKAVVLNYLGDKQKSKSKLTLRTVISPSKNKHTVLLELLESLGNEPGIVFCNKKDTIEDLSAFLNKKRLEHTCFHAGMEQIDRERALIQLRNGSVSVLIASDLASRGLDIPEMKYIIHFEIPEGVEEFTHRNGRTARVDSKGTAYILKYTKSDLPDFVGKSAVLNIPEKKTRKAQHWTTLFISGGRKDKISKGDIAGLFFKQGNINKDQLGVIELKQDCAFVAVPVSIADKLVESLNNTKVKKKKVRVTLL